MAKSRKSSRTSAAAVEANVVPACKIDLETLHKKLADPKISEETLRKYFVVDEERSHERVAPAYQHYGSPDFTFNVRSTAKSGTAAPDANPRKERRSEERAKPAISRSARRRRSTANKRARERPKQR